MNAQLELEVSGEQVQGLEHILFLISQIILLIAQFRVIWCQPLATGCELPHTQGQLRMFSFCWAVCQEVPGGPWGPVTRALVLEWDRSGVSLSSTADELWLIWRSHLTPLSLCLRRGALTHSPQCCWDDPVVG